MPLCPAIPSDFQPLLIPNIMQETGSISIHTENIFPIIKKFLYSDHEIFLRELVSNAVDATQKLKSLAQLGEYRATSAS